MPLFLKRWRRVLTMALVGGMLMPTLFVAQADDKISENKLLLTVDLQNLANDAFAKELRAGITPLDGIPFKILSGKRNHLNLHTAVWPEWQKDPASYYENYDMSKPDAALFRFSLHRADYIAAHLLAVAEDDPALTNIVTLRAGLFEGQFTGKGGIIEEHFQASVPRRNGALPRKISSLDTPGGRLFHVSIPMPLAFAQDIERDRIDFELTKEIRLAVRRPDPCRFRLRPLGLPSGVRIAAVTLEKSPLQMRVSSDEIGHAFVQPRKPLFKVHLENISAVKQAFTLKLEAEGLNGDRSAVMQRGSLPAGEAVELNIPVKVGKCGYYDLRLSLLDGEKKLLLQRQTSFALLPPDTRRYRAQSPFGTWDFGGSHWTPDKADQVGPLYVKAGLRYGMFTYTAAERARYGVLRGNEPKVLGSAQNFAANIARHADQPPFALIFHEDSISGRHVTRVPDLFHDRPPYRLDAKEQERFDSMWQQALDAGRAMRREFPNIHIRLGNGPLPTKEEFYRRGFPAELFDSAGNEPGSFGRMPETQPPDYVANNASIWMDRQMLDAYGYGDKPVTQCYEVIYPGSNPGNLDQRLQAQYFVRHCLHSLAWGIREIRPGGITDVGNSYYYSNWGSTGLCNRRPEMSVKPAYVAMATMTLALDGATWKRTLDTGSASLYCLEFSRPDGESVYALWTVRGRRPMQLKVSGGDWRYMDDQGNATPLSVTNDLLSLTASPAPAYLTGSGMVTAVTAGRPSYSDSLPVREVLLADNVDLGQWSAETERHNLLEFYNFATPRRKGDFAFRQMDKFEGHSRALQVEPRPISHGKDTMPMYGVLRHRQGIALKGEPAAISLWVNGNSSWGRIIFELKDASGQTWTSIGAPQSGDYSVWLQDWMPKEMQEKSVFKDIADWNTDDVFGFSRINFDGWRRLFFPLPGQYEGEGYHWPAGSQWRWDGDGIVHYPLKLTSLAVELPARTLQVRDYKPVRRPEVYLGALHACYGDPQKVWLQLQKGHYR